MTAELLAALLLPCRFHAHGESRLPSGAQFRQGLGAVRQRWADEADDGTQDAPGGREATLRLERFRVPEQPVNPAKEDQWHRRPTRIW